MTKENTICIIPARGGSQRIPKKNIISFNGMPMIGWTIRAAIDSNLFDRIIVSTDSDEIAEVSREYGGEVPFLRDQYADNQSHVSEATLRSLGQAEAHFGKRWLSVIQLMPNCPLRTTDDIKSAFQFFQSGGHNFQLSCFKYGWMNPWWAHRIDEKHQAIPLFDEEMRLRRSQDQPDLYCPTGAIWCARTDAFKKAGTFHGKNYKFFPMPWQNALDIDDYDDLQYAKILAK